MGLREVAVESDSAAVFRSVPYPSIIDSWFTEQLGHAQFPVRYGFISSLSPVEALSSRYLDVRFPMSATIGFNLPGQIASLRNGNSS